MLKVRSRTNELVVVRVSLLVLVHDVLVNFKSGLVFNQVVQ
jgi:hypothetical protein